MNYVRKLGFEETPDYDFLRDLFSKVLKTLGEPEDGVFDWMLLNGGKGWEAGHAHANAAAPHTPHRDREHRSRHHDGHLRSRPALQDGTQTPSSPLVLAPTPAHHKPSRRAVAAQQQESRGNSRNDVSVQPVPPASRRASQQQITRTERDSTGLTAPHPYAITPSPGARGTAYGRSSPNGGAGGAVPPANGANTSDSFVYGQQGKPGTNSREGTTTAGTATAGGARDAMAGMGNRGINMYDREQMARVGEQDEHGHGRKKGFWAAFCCRG